MRSTWPQAAAGAEPAPAVCNLLNKEIKMANLYVFHQGSGDNGQLWYFSFDGTKWYDDRQVEHVGMTDSPSAIPWAGGISVFTRGSPRIHSFGTRLSMAQTGAQTRKFRT